MSVILFFDLLGSFLNLIGSILVAFSIGKHPEEPMYLTDDNGKTFHVAYCKNPLFFNIGIIMMGASYFLSILGKIL